MVYLYGMIYDLKMKKIAKTLFIYYRVRLSRLLGIDSYYRFGINGPLTSVPAVYIYISVQTVLYIIIKYLVRVIIGGPER